MAKLPTTMPSQANQLAVVAERAPRKNQFRNVLHWLVRGVLQFANVWNVNIVIICVFFRNCRVRTATTSTQTNKYSKPNSAPKPLNHLTDNATRDTNPTFTNRL